MQQVSGIGCQVSGRPLAAEKPVIAKMKFLVFNDLHWIVGAVFNRDGFGLRYAANRGYPAKQKQDAP